jgi:hypothetical protein
VLHAVLWYSGILLMCGKRERRQEGLILKQRIAVADPTRPSGNAPRVEVGVAEDPRDIPQM